MPPRGKPKKGGSQNPREQTQPAGPEDVLAEAEMLIERGERKLRDQEPVKARVIFEQVVQRVRAANLTDHPSGCLMVATATGSLLQISSGEARLAGWARRGVSLPPPPPAPLTPEVRRAAPQLCATALDNGFAAAKVAGAPAEELSHLLDSRAQLATFISEELEAEAEALHTTRGPDAPHVDERALAAAAAALEEAERAVGLWDQAGGLLLTSSARPEVVGTLPDDWEAAAEWEPEPDVDLLSSLASACLRRGRLLMQAASAAERRGGSAVAVAAEARTTGEASVARALALYEVRQLESNRRLASAGIEPEARVSWNRTGGPDVRPSRAPPASAHRQPDLGLISLARPTCGLISVRPRFDPLATVACAGRRRACTATRNEGTPSTSCSRIGRRQGISHQAPSTSRQPLPVIIISHHQSVTISHHQ
jgi:hypothetical protein